MKQTTKTKIILYSKSSHTQQYFTKRIRNHLRYNIMTTDKETTNTAAANSNAASTANPPPAPPAAEAIEEDDEFEEFEPCHWDKRDEDAEDSQQWQVSGYSIFF